MGIDTLVVAVIVVTSPSQPVIIEHVPSKKEISFKQEFDEADRAFERAYQVELDFFKKKLREASMEAVKSASKKTESELRKVLNK